jgi:hypothetical protein
MDTSKNLYDWKGGVYMGEKNRYFTREFKFTAVQLVTEKGMPIGKVAQSPSEGLIHHSDRGRQYASYAYQDLLHGVNGRYTGYFNRKYRRSGHLFQGRYKGILVDKDTYLVQLSRYVHLNPVRAKIVEMPEQYRWSSYPGYIGKSGECTCKDGLNLKYK